MTIQELQIKLQQEQTKQVELAISKTLQMTNQQFEVLNTLNSYLPKVNEWLQMLNMISQSGVRYFVKKTDYQYIKKEYLKKCWILLTDSINHDFGIYGIKISWDYPFAEGYFTKMGCKGGGCDGDDVWTDGKNWYHGNVKLIGKIGEIPICKAKGVIKRIQEFEIYFNELLKTLG